MAMTTADAGGLESLDDPMEDFTPPFRPPSQTDAVPICVALLRNTPNAPNREVLTGYGVDGLLTLPVCAKAVY